MGFWKFLNHAPAAARPASLRRQAWSGVLWVSSGSGLQALLQFSVLVVLARLLTPAEFGLVGATLLVMSFGTMFSQLGVGPALVQRADLTEEHIHAAGTISIVLGLATWLIVWACAGLAESFFRLDGIRELVTVVALTFPLRGLSLVSEAMLQRQMRFQVLAGTEVVAYAIGYGLIGVGLAFADYGVWALIAAYVTQTIVRTVLVINAARPPFRLEFARPLWYDLLHFGTGHTIGSLGGYFAEQSDNLVVGRWLGAEMLGFYGRSFQFLAVPARLFGVVSDRVIFPIMARGQNNRAGLTSGYLDCLALISLLTIPSSIALSLLSSEAVSVALGPNWEGAVVPLRILALVLVFRMTSKVGKSLARAEGAVYATASRQWAFAAMMVAFTLVGKRWGLAGVAGGVLLANAWFWLATLQLSRKLIGVPWTGLAMAFVPGSALGALWAASGSFVVPWLRSNLHSSIAVSALSILLWIALTLVAWLSLPRLFLGHHVTEIVGSVKFLKFIRRPSGSARR